MCGNKPFWLPHLTREVVADAHGYDLCAYVIALEGWRRGLTLRWHTKDSEKFKEMKTWYVDTPGRLFSLSSKERTHYFFRSRGDKVTNGAVDIGGDKEATKAWLSQAGLAVPKGKRFGASVPNDEIIKYASSTLGFPVVLKPTDGSFGRGVITNIKKNKDLKKALNTVRSRYPDVIVEQYIPGEEYRIYVVGDQVAGVIRRRPANVVGDGLHSIKELIDLKNEVRSENPRLISCPIKIDEEIKSFIKAKGYTLDSIPEKGLRVFLSGKSNISLGGDPIEVTDKLHSDIKRAAVQALKAIPGLTHGGVDLIVDESSPKSSAQAVIIELNPTAQIGSLLYPMEGHAKDIPSAIIDYYFPETKNDKSQKSSFYFDFNYALEPLRNKAATVTKVSPAPLGQAFAKKYTVPNSAQNINFQRWLKKQAQQQCLHGFVNAIDKGNIEVVIAGNQRREIDRYKEFIKQKTGEEIVTENFDKPVKIGFDIKAGPKKLEEEWRRLKQSLSAIEREKNRVERQLMRYRQSTSWKLTKPLRQTADLAKNVRRLVK